MAWVDAETVTTLIAAHGEDRSTVLRPAYDGEPGWPVLLPLRHLDALRRAGRRPDAVDLLDDLEAAGVPFRVVETGDPGVTHDVSTPRADLPPFDGPPEPATRTRRSGASRRRTSPTTRRSPARRASARPTAEGHAPPEPPHRRRRPPRPRRGPRRRVRVVRPAAAAPARGDRLARLHAPMSSSRGRRPARVVAARRLRHRADRLPGRRRSRPRRMGRSRRTSPATGYLVVITPMPFNLAVLGIGEADGVIAAHPEVTTWAMAGHSLGGSMAAQYVERQPGRDPRPRLLGRLRGDRPVRARPVGRLDLRLARRRRRPDVGRRGACQPARRRGVRRDPGRQPRADGLLHGPAERPARDDQPRGPAGAGRGGHGRRCSTGWRRPTP